MSTTEQRPTPGSGNEPPTAPSEAKPKIDLSLTQVVGGALAAMTAAFLGSRLSLAGTVAGAAVASVVAAVASNVYTASLRSTQKKVRTVFRGHVAGSEVPVTVQSADETFTWDGGQPAAAQTPAPAQPAHRLRWQSIVLGALAAFVLAAVVLTGLELASGQSLSGGNGTTISQVAEHQPTATPTSDPTPTATTSPTPSATDSPEPSASASSEPTATPSAAEPTPSATSSATTSPTPSASSTASATAGAGDGDQAGSADQGTGTGTG